ncbi:MAG: hypothetical protein J6Z82_00250 [Schwartzia sp.]|nr:hypothetical protein [Schwartzia sp. (in: firmicutes)]
MEPDRYWFLYFGLLFLFLSSKVGKMSFFLVFDFLRAGFFLTLALLAAIASKACWVVGVLLFRLGACIKAKREASAAVDGEK